MCVCFSLSQGEVGEPGQKGSKADKGEQVCFLSSTHSPSFSQSCLHIKKRHMSDFDIYVIIGGFVLFTSRVLLVQLVYKVP